MPGITDRCYWRLNKRRVVSIKQFYRAIFAVNWHMQKLFQILLDFVLCLSSWSCSNTPAFSQTCPPCLWWNTWYHLRSTSPPPPPTTTTRSYQREYLFNTCDGPLRFRLKKKQKHLLYQWWWRIPSPWHGPWRSSPAGQPGLCRHPRRAASSPEPSI